MSLSCPRLLINPVFNICWYSIIKESCFDQEYSHSLDPDVSPELFLDLSLPPRVLCSGLDCHHITRHNRRIRVMATESRHSLKIADPDEYFICGASRVKSLLWLFVYLLLRDGVFVETRSLRHWPARWFISKNYCKLDTKNFGTNDKKLLIVTRDREW